MLCQGTEERGKRMEQCEKPELGDALENGVITTWDIQHIEPLPRKRRSRCEWRTWGAVMKNKTLSSKKKVSWVRTSTMVAGVLSMMISMNIVQAADMETNSSAGASGSRPLQSPHLVRTIDLSHIGSVVAIRKLSFSPDSRYLGIVLDPEMGKTDIVVWNMETGKPQSHIHCPYQYGVLTDHDLLWSRDGKTISFGAKRQWDPMTGEALPDNPAIGRAARLNKDGSKMLTIVGALGQPSYIHVYDTQTWEVQKIYLDGFVAISANWTAKGKIFVNTSLSHALYSKSIDGYQPQTSYDKAYRLLDPTGNNMAKTLWLKARETGDAKEPFTYSADAGVVVGINPETNQIILGSGIVLDGETLDINRSYQDFLRKIFDGELGFLISNDGKRMYTKGALFKYGDHKSTPNRVIDFSSNKVIAEFDALVDHGDGFSLGADGKSLAIANSKSVQIYQVQ